MTAERSYNVRFWNIQQRSDGVARFRVRWTVDGHPFSESFVEFELADSFRSELKTAARRGESFDAASGLPASASRVIRILHDTTQT